MSYLSQYATDLFISYSHLDNQDDSPWVTRLHRDLERRLSQYLGTAVEIWRDARLQGNEFLTPAIEEQLRQVAVMVSVVSPRYFLSDWCRRELQGFLSAAGSNGTGARSRLFKLVPTPVEPQYQLPAIKDLLGYDFYRVDEGNGTPRRLPDRDPSAGAEKAYLAKVDDVAYDIYRLLKQLSAPPATTTASAKVYLAETSSDLAQNRDQIRRELLARGHRVFPEQQLPYESEGLIETVRRDLDGCDLSIHMIGSRYGIVPDGSSRSVVWLQQELAVARQTGQDAFRCVLWMPPDLEVKEEWQRKSINDLQEQLKDQNRFELLKTPLEGLKNYIFERLAPKVVKPPTRSRGVPLERRRIYLICEARDFQAVEPLRACLFDSQVSVDLPLREGDQQEIRLEHEATLQECDGVLIYYGAGSEGWLREKIRDLRKSRGLGRSKPFAPQGIYLAPELTESKQSYVNPEFLVMKNFGAFSRGDLRPFLDRIEGAGGAPNKGATA